MIVIEDNFRFNGIGVLQVWYLVIIALNMEMEWLKDNKHKTKVIMLV
jgi:hypothetical protein